MSDTTLAGEVEEPCACTGCTDTWLVFLLINLILLPICAGAVYVYYKRYRNLTDPADIEVTSKGRAVYKNDRNAICLLLFVLFFTGFGLLVAVRECDAIWAVLTLTIVISGGLLYPLQFPKFSDEVILAQVRVKQPHALVVLGLVPPPPSGKNIVISLETSGEETNTQDPHSSVPPSPASRVGKEAHDNTEIHSVSEDINSDRNAESRSGAAQQDVQSEDGQNQGSGRKVDDDEERRPSHGPPIKTPYAQAVPDISPVVKTSPGLTSHKSRENMATTAAAVPPRAPTLLTSTIDNNASDLDPEIEDVSPLEEASAAAIAPVQKNPLDQFSPEKREEMRRDEEQRGSQEHDQFDKIIF